MKYDAFILTEIVYLTSLAVNNFFLTRTASDFFVFEISLQL